MDYVTLYNGVKMPMIGFGTVSIFDEVCEESVANAIVNGYRMIDAAHMYKNEKEVGNGIQKGLERTGLKREDLFIVSKINVKFTSYEKAKEGIRLSLENLKTDYLDLYLVHEPYPEAVEMYRALEEAYEEGLVRAIGISNFNQLGYDRFCAQVNVKPMVNQIESHILYPQKAFKEYMKSQGTVAEAWAPFASGAAHVSDNETLIKIGERYGKTPNQVALRYLIQQGTPCIPRSSNVERQKQNIDVFDFALNAEEMAEIEKLDGGKTLYDWMEEWDAAEAAK